MKQSILEDKKSHTQLSGYSLLEQLHCGPRSAVYRAIAVGETQPVVVKLLTVDNPSTQDLLQFQHQYTIAKMLSSPDIIQPYALQSYRRGYALVMEDYGGISLDRYQLTHPLSIETVLKIAIKLTDIFQTLQQQRIIHKDIKPANILMHPDTGQVKLIDFGIASLLPHETPEILSPGLLEGTLAYLSPEQSGRMNRGIDYRTDFYALGVTLYELLSGQLPFVSEDPMELVHCHLTQSATPVHKVQPSVPEALSQLVAKLMAKNVEDRYQSAAGLRYDLDQCLMQWRGGRVATFPLGEQDTSERFLVPETLYGRKAEVQTLLSAFDRAAAGGCEIVLISGLSGIGKTRIVNEVHRPIVRQRGYFVKGKFDQFNRNIPFSAFIQALRDLIDQILSESDAQLMQWRARILEGLDQKGQVLTALIPELEQVIGKQPAVPELIGREAQNRFEQLFQSFIGVFTTADHPLVLFLDDLQWADLASLRLIDLLMKGSYLLILGAYRDNEVSSSHPLQLTLKELEAQQVTLHTVTLQPLAFDDMQQLVADALNSSQKLAEPLTQLVDLKTKGNPFFVRQFLKTLQAEGYIRFDRTLGYWVCDIERVTTLALAEDVVEFMTERLQKLPDPTQQSLKLAACIGNQFDLETLAIISAQTTSQAAESLWPALQDGLILPKGQVYKFFQPAALAPTSRQPNPTYRFLHDRVQQAAYSLIPAAEKQLTHFKIGQRLQASAAEPLQAEKLFEIIGHLNVAFESLPTQAERDQLAQMNLQAAQKAQAATASAAACRYAKIGLELLGADGWHRQYALALGLQEALTTAALLQGDFEAIPTLAQTAFEQTKTPLDRVRIYEILIKLHTVQQQYPEAIAKGLEILQLLGLRLSTHPSKVALVQAVSLAQLALLGKSNAALLNLKEVTDPQQIAVLRILDLLQIPAYFYSQNFMVIVVTWGIQLTLRYGNNPWAASFYTAYVIILSKLGDLKTSCRIGQLALDLIERYSNPTIEAQVKGLVPWFSLPWTQPLRSSVALVDEGLKAAINSGNLSTMGICAQMTLLIRLFADLPLDQVAAKAQEIEPLIAQSKDEASQQVFFIEVYYLNSLRGTSEILPLAETEEELACIERWKQQGETTLLASLYSRKTELAYLFSKIDLALHYASCRRPYADVERGLRNIQEWMYGSLVQLAAYAQARPKAQRQIMQEVRQNQRQLRKRAQQMPANFQHRYDLVEAEKCRVLGKWFEAADLYDRAISGAKENGFMPGMALANELAAQFYLHQGKERIAAGYLEEAHYFYGRWGAMAKVQDLEQRFPQLKSFIAAAPTSVPLSLASLQSGTETNHSSQTGLDNFDLKASLQAAQALASDIKLPTLIQQLVRLLLKSSGAEICLPILLQYRPTPKSTVLVTQNDWQVYDIRADSENASGLVSYALSEYEHLPHRLINQVRRQSKTVVLDLQTTDPATASDPYLQHHQPQSVMVLPLLLQGELRGIVYLENRKVAHLFTPERQTMLEFLASQAVTTLYNAQLCESVSQRSVAIEALLDGIAILEEGRFIYMNPSHARMFGYEIDELIGQSWECLYATEQVEQFQATAFPALGSSGQWIGEAVALRKDKSTFDEEVTLLTLDKGQLICICRDITARKTYEHDLKRANAELLRATRLKDEFLATMSHELRTPLNAILGMSEALQEEVFGAVNERQVKSLGTIERSGRHLLSLINDILDVSKISAGKLSLNTDKVEVSELFRSSLALIGQQAHDKQISLKTQLPPYPSQIAVDERRMRQVLINLLSNAVKFTPSGGAITLSFVRPPSTVDAAGDLAFLEFTVSDTGIGIALEDQSKLFQPFTQLDSSLNRQYEGTGLGLTLVKQIVELHGGSIALESEPGRGSCFTVRLPASCWVTVPQQPSLPENGASLPSTPDAAGQTGSILLVEDNQANINTFSSYLTARGYSVTVATNGREAITVAQRERPRLILMDIQMPEMDGLEAIAHIRQDPQLSAVPIVALTALAMQGDQEQCLAAGATAYLAKPVKLRHLHQTIQELLERG